MKIITYIFLIFVIFLVNHHTSYAANRHLAYGENIGWINLEPDDGPAFTITDSSITGNVWGENIGWINMSPLFSGVANDGQGNLSGWAWGENIGWISFSCDNKNSCGNVEYKVTFDKNTGLFSGLAWGENVGWIRFPDNPYPPILLPINKGYNLFYVSSVYKKPYLAPYNTHIDSLYYYDQNSSWVNSKSTYMKKDSLHALYASNPGTLFLDLKEISYPILNFQGFLNEAYSTTVVLPPGQCVAPETFNLLNYFDSNRSCLEVLMNFNGLKIITGKDSKTGGWESSYNFFGKPAGVSVDFKSRFALINIIK